MATPAPKRPPTSQYVDFFSKSALKRIAKALGLGIPTGDSTSLVAVIARALGTASHRALLDRQLGDDQWTLLISVALRGGEVRLGPLMSVLTARGVESRAALTAIGGLLEVAALLPTGGGAYGSAHIGIEPSALTQAGVNATFVLAPGVGDWAVERARRSQPRSVEPPATTDPMTLPDLQRAVLLILAEARQKPIRITAQGWPYQADANRLAIALTARVTGRGGKPKPPAGGLPAVGWFALAALVGAQLLDDGGEGLSLAPTAEADAFFRRPLAEQVKILTQGWLVSPFNDFPRVESLSFYSPYGERLWSPLFEAYAYRDQSHAAARAIVLHVLELALARAPDRWYAIEDVSALIQTYCPDLLYSRFDEYAFYRLSYASYGGAYAEQQKSQRRQYPITRAPMPGQPKKDLTLYMDTDWNEVEGAYIRQVCADALRWLGLVDLGPAGHPERFRLTDLGRHVLLGAPVVGVAEPERRQAIVQPSFEVVVLDATASAALVAQLEQFAERRSLDRAATYVLTQAALVRGMDRGWTRQQVVETLEAATGGPLPQNVRFSIDDWARLYEQLTLREAATLLEADNPDQLERWLADATLAGLLGRRITPTAILVPARNAVAVAQRIDQIGQSLYVVNYAIRPEKILTVKDPDVIELPADDAEPYLCYKLEAFSTPIEQKKRAIRYQITAESLRRANELGQKPQQIIDFLVTASGGPLPNDVLVRILGWGGAIKPARTEPVVAVQLDPTPIDWGTLLPIKAIGHYVRAMPRADLALVAAGDLEALRQALAERGISVVEGRVVEQYVATADPIVDLSALFGEAAGRPLSPLDELRALIGPRRVPGPAKRR